MQLTHYTDFGIRTLMYMALHAERRSLFRIAEITDTFNLSANHVAKIVHHLGKSGYLETVRGRHGGFRLARPAMDINLGALVRELEHSLVAIDCSKPECRLLPVCRLKGVLAQAVEAYLAVLDRYSLADIISNRDDLLTILPDSTISTSLLG